MIIRKTAIKTVAHYILIYLLLISSGAWIYSLNSINIRYLILIVCGIYLIKRIRKKSYFYVAAYLVGIMVFMLLEMGVFLQPYYSTKMLMLLEQFLIAFVAFDYDKENFTNRFVKLCAAFALISLLFYVVQLIKPSILSSYLTANVGWGEGTVWEMTFYGKLFYVYRYNPLTVIEMRNNGIYSEPGLYQMVLNSALFLLLFFPDLVYVKSKTKKMLIILFVVTCLTTASTTGYIGLLIIFLGFFALPNTYREKKFKHYVTSIIFLVMMLLIVNYYLTGDDSILSSFMFSKLSDLLTTQSGTGAARTNTISLMFSLLASNPIIGVGYGRVADAVATLTDTGGAIFMEMVAGCGIPFTIYMLYPHFKNALRGRYGILTGMVWIGLYLNTTLAQSREIYPALIVLAHVLSFSRNYVGANPSEGNQIS